jgi:transposase-like protein
VDNINLAIASGVSIKAIAKRYEVSVASLYRHARRPRCLPPQLKAKLIAGPTVEGVDLDKLRESESQSLLMNIIGLRLRLLGALRVAEEVGDGSMIAKLSGQVHQNLELSAKVNGVLGAGSTTINNNLFVLPDYIELRAAITRALAPYPQARAELAEALHALEAKAAKDISSETRTLQFAGAPRKAEDEEEPS